MSAYEPPRLVKAKDRWYVSFYAPDDLNKNARKHFRPTFNLNKITNLREREQRALELIAKIKIWLDAGKPISQFDEMKVKFSAALQEEATSLLHTPIREALNHILAIKKELRADSYRSFDSISNLFYQFLEKKKWHRLQVGEVSKVHVRAYLDDCLITRKLAPVSWNNQVTVLRVIFNDMKERGFVLENPLDGIKKKKKLPKTRRNFTQEEARIVLARVRQESELLFYFVLLEYCCYFRPEEIRKLRFRDFDFTTGLVTLDSGRTKDWDNRIATIPTDFIPFFNQEFFKRYPQNSYVFGAGFEPGKMKHMSKQVAFRRHEAILKQLVKEGKLDNMVGLVLYSWKDTGITDALEMIPILNVQDQAGHSSPNETMKYRHKAENTVFQKGFRNNVLP